MKKFRDMTDSEKLEIIKNKPLGYVEVYTGSYWDKSSLTVINLEYIYRIKKQPMSIDWSVLKDEFICAIRDASGKAYAYESKPDLHEHVWLSSVNSEVGFDLNHLKSYDPGTVDWTESLIWRPGFERKGESK